jgi:hypothetical protein
MHALTRWGRPVIPQQRPLSPWSFTILIRISLPMVTVCPGFLVRPSSGILLEIPASEKILSLPVIIFKFG